MFRLRKSLLVLLFSFVACAPGDADEEVSSASSDLSYDSAFGDRIANVARRVDGRASGNRCLAEMQNSLEMANVRKFPRLPGAVDLDNFMLNQGASLRAWGFEKQSMAVDAIPRGSIVAWRPGQCGYHSTYGHIEIAIGGGRACSDFCGTIKRGCGAPNVYVPVGGGGGADACGVRADRKLHCANRPNVALRAAPNASSAVVDTLRTSLSWFSCFTNGEPHAGGNSTWYFTTGDDAGRQGFLPAVNLQTTSSFDADPTAAGLPRCP